MEARPTVGSCFSGIDGLAMGFEWAGWETRWQIENDPFCLDILNKHWPEVKKYDNIIGTTPTERVDCIVGGFPCQPFSHAGRRSAEADDRYLWPEMLRIVRELRPSFVVAENVYGLVTIKSGLVLETVYLDLEDAGYEVAPPIVFPAAAVGAPHRRDRVWICAHARHDGYRSEFWQQQEARPDEHERVREAITDADSARLQSTVRYYDQARLGGFADSDSTNADAYRKLVEGSGAEGQQVSGASEASQRNSGISSGREQWETEPDVVRMVHGSAPKFHRERIKAMGNMVVPQAAYVVAQALKESGK